MKRITKSGAFRNRRYSGYYLWQGADGPSSTEADAPGAPTGSGWTSQNTVDVINTGAGLIQNVLTSIFGRNNIQHANYTTELYKQEQRTNTILWVIIGLVLALVVFLVIRKTK